MVKKREIRGQPGKKYRLSRQVMDVGREFHWAINCLRKETALICIYRVMCMEEMMLISWSWSGWSCDDERLGNCNKLMLGFEKHDESCYTSPVHQCFPLQLLYHLSWWAKVVESAEGETCCPLLDHFQVIFIFPYVVRIPFCRRILQYRSQESVVG